MISQRAFVVTLLACLLAGCGGGGGGAGNDPPSTTPPPGSGAPNDPPPAPPPPDPAAEEEANARNARVRMLQVDTQLLINWVDLFDDELGYQVQRRVGEATWETVEALPALDGGSGVWSRAVPTSAHYRVVAALEERSLPLHSTGNETELYIDVDPARTMPTIQLDQTEPVRGPVRVSMQNVGSALSVAYSIGGAQFARATDGGIFAATLPAEQLVDGLVSLGALVEKSPGLLLLISRSLQVDNPAAAVLLAFSSPAAPEQELLLRARASSDAGITGVEFFANGNSLQVVSAPNGQGEYVYSVDTTALPPGANVFRAVATDSIAATAIMERTFTIDRAPTLHVTGLFDGMIASGDAATVTGEFGDDAPGATLTITAGDERLLWTQTSPFAATLSLANIPPGEHSVTIRVRDMFGKVSSLNYNVIVPSTSLSYQLLDTGVERILAADQGALLYRKSNGIVVLRDSAGAPMQLPDASAGFLGYGLTAGRIFAWAEDGHIHSLDASGEPTDISPHSGFAGATGLAASGPLLSWQPADDASMFKLYNLQTGVLRDVPIGATLPQQRPEILGAPGNEQLLLHATLDGTEGIYRHDLVTNSTQLIMSGMVFGPQSDGSRILWWDHTQSPPILLAAPLSNPTATTVLSSDNAIGALDEGVAVWFDRQYQLFANDGSVTTLLASPVSFLPQAFALNDGQVVYSENGRMQVWSPARGERVWLDTTALALHASGVAYFLTGSSGALYSVTLP